MADQRKQSVSPVWQLLGTIVTAASTVAVAYFTAIKPAANKAVKESIEEQNAERDQAVPVAVNSTPIRNITGYRLLLIGFCNATEQGKEIAVFVDSSNDASKMRLVASESGTDRLTVTCVVPPNFYYRVTYTQVPGGGCDVTAWKL